VLYPVVEQFVLLSQSGVSLLLGCSVVCVGPRKALAMWVISIGVESFNLEQVCFLPGQWLRCSAPLGDFLNLKSRFSLRNFTSCKNLTPRSDFPWGDYYIWPHAAPVARSYTCARQGACNAYIALGCYYGGEGTNPPSK
jgi:hypothetical protein